MVRGSAPDAPGIYELGLKKEGSIYIRYIGSSNHRIKDRIMEHFSDGDEPKPGCNRFRYTVLPNVYGFTQKDPEEQKRTHLRIFESQNNQLPHFNHNRHPLE